MTKTAPGPGAADKNGAHEREENRQREVSAPPPVLPSADPLTARYSTEH